MESDGLKAKLSTDDQMANTEALTEDQMSDWQPGSEPALRQPGLSVTSHPSPSSRSHYDFDVITVHGLRDDYKTAWTREDETWWVKDALFKGRSIRQVDYAYDIDEEAVIYEADGIKLHAKALIEAYAQNRSRLQETDRHRSVIWICHDLGGTIVKEALRLALNDRRKYGEIAILTTAIIFLGTPHRFHSAKDARHQLLKLVSLPVSKIEAGLIDKIENLVFQVEEVNKSFLETRLLYRVIIFNVYVQSQSHNIGEIQDRDDQTRTIKKDGDQISDSVTPFSTCSHTIGHALGSIYSFPLSKTNHVDIVLGDGLDAWMKYVFKPLNQIDSTVGINREIFQFQVNMLSLAPPTIVSTEPVDSIPTMAAVVNWIAEQKPYTDFNNAGAEFRILHLYANQGSPVDMEKVSRQIYAQTDNNPPKQSIIYFEFDQWDFRYNNISSMMIYIINTVMWHLWDTLPKDRLLQEIQFLNDAQACSPEDLYHLHRKILWHASLIRQITIFVNCFDRCPEVQRRWFMERTLKERQYSGEEFRLILSTSTRNSLGVERLPDTASINVDDCPCLGNINKDNAEKLATTLKELLIKRAIFKRFERQLKTLIRECESTPNLGCIILNWLGNLPRRAIKSQTVSTIRNLSPVTAENTVSVIVSSLTPDLRMRAEKIFNWVKHAIEPWTLESLSEALSVDDCYEEGTELSEIDDIDAKDLADEMTKTFAGIISIKNRDIKFSDDSFYLVPDLGLHGSAEERAAEVNRSIAEACLRYLQLGSVHKTLDEISSRTPSVKDGNSLFDSVVISRPRVSMAEYAVQFWPTHYRASGKLKPDLVKKFFASEETTSRWATMFWLFSSPFTRTLRKDIVGLPMYAMLGLEDLVDEELALKTGQSSFHQACWLAISEAARAGHSAIVHKLLQHVPVDEEELQNALCLGAGQGNAEIVKALVEKISDSRSFPWPNHLFHRAASIGLDSLLTAMLQSGYDINTLSSSYEAPALHIAVMRNCISSADILLKSNPKPDLNIQGEGDYERDGVVPLAVMVGEPRMMANVFEAGGSKDEKSPSGQTLAQIAARYSKHEALKLLIEAGCDLGGKNDEGVDISLRHPLIIAANRGATECARTLLLHNKAYPINSGTIRNALHDAVGKGHTDIVRLLLEHDPEQDLNAHFPGKLTLLRHAMNTEDTELVSLLIRRGADVNALDATVGLYQAPLSLACKYGRLDMVKLLVENGADVNFNAEGSLPPLLAATGAMTSKKAKYLLQISSIDINITGPRGLNSLISAVRHSSLVRVFLAKGLPINSNSGYGTALIRAASANFTKTIQVLLKHDPKPDLECICGDDSLNKGIIGFTALQVACHSENPECVKLLLDAGANASFRNKKGHDALDILLQTNQGSRRVEECFKLLLSGDNGSNADYANEQRQTRLHFIKKTTRVSIIELLVTAKVPFDTTDEDGYTPLAVAVKNGNRRAVKYLVERGARVEVFSPVFSSILHIAVLRVDISLLKLLFNAGATGGVAYGYMYGESLLYTALDIADESNLKIMVKYLVDKAKVPINQFGGEFGYPIIRAASLARTNQSISEKIIKFLLTRKADLDVTDKQGRTALHIACTTPCMDVVKALVEAGADVNAKDKIGRLPIHFAAAIPSADVFAYVLGQCKDVNIDVTDNDGWTPLLWAARSGAAETITKLVDLGANLWARSYATTPGKKWSALKLMKFSGNHTELSDKLVPKDRIRTNSEGSEEWESNFHEIRVGHEKSVACRSCCVIIRGEQSTCVECSDDFSLCFKCCDHKNVMHDPAHEFWDTGPMYHDEDTNSYGEGQDLDGWNIFDYY